MSLDSNRGSSSLAKRRVVIDVDQIVSYEELPRNPFGTKTRITTKMKLFDRDSNGSSGTANIYYCVADDIDTVIEKITTAKKKHFSCR